MRENSPRYLQRLAWPAAAAFTATHAGAQISVPSGFVVEQLAPRLDSSTPRVEAVGNTAQGGR